MCVCDVFRALINSLVCGVCTGAPGLDLFHVLTLRKMSVYYHYYYPMKGEGNGRRKPASKPRKCANSFMCVLHLAVTSIFIHKNYFLRASNLSCSGQSHVRSLFINGDQKQLAGDVFETLTHIAAFVVLLRLTNRFKGNDGKLLRDGVECT